MPKTAIEFEVTTTVRQEIKIVNMKYTVEDIVKNLNDGVFVTSMGLIPGAEIVDEDDNVVAEIVNWEEFDDRKLMDFRKA